MQSLGRHFPPRQLAPEQSMPSINIGVKKQPIWTQAREALALANRLLRVACAS